MMIPLRSIKGGLMAAFLLFLLLLTLLGAFAIKELWAVNQVSAEISDRWLASTRVLGDLNNFTSDARTAEASRLLAQDEAQKTAADQEIGDLSRKIAQSIAIYRKIPHDDEEEKLYRRFTKAWQAYEEIATKVLALSRLHRNVEGITIYLNASLKANKAASDALGLLTDYTVEHAGRASDRALATYRAARNLILVTILLAALSLIAVVHYITSTLSRPLLALAARMRSLAANDTTSSIEGAGRRDEIGEMARAVVVFRNTAVELAHSQLGLVRQAAMLEERLETEQKLTSLQRNFVSMASHEFRTPLTIIDGQAQRLLSLRDALSPDSVAERIGRIRAAVRRMTHSMEHLLNSSRLFDGDAALYYHPVSIDPAALLQEVCQLYREISPGARITERLHHLPPTMIGDPNLLHQAFSNLFSNAIKYSPDGAAVELIAWAEGGCLVITVEDHGLGIPAGDRDRVFDRYHRGTNVRGIVGTGVGLYLVKMVTDLHNGKVAVESREGQGARFTIYLPLDVH